MEINYTSTSSTREFRNINNNMISLLNTVNSIKTNIENMGGIQSNYIVNQNIIPNNIKQNVDENNHNVLMIMCDELVMLESLPDKFKDSLPGYNALKSIGLNFTNYHNNRQMCSPSRSVYMSGKIDCGIIDNVEQPWQYLCKTDTKDMNSLGKIFKLNAPNYFTSFYGKSHLDSKLIPNLQIQPRFQNNTINAMKSYGFDRFNTNGDALHFAHGFFSDSCTYNTSLPLDAVTHDIEENGLKFEGALPFLKARTKDKINFFCEVNFHNPHDINHFWTVPTQTPLPTGDMLQYGVPYFTQQIADGNLSNSENDLFNKPIGNNIYKFDDDFEDAYIKNVSITKDWFNVFGDVTYNAYKTNTSTLLYKETMQNSYWNDDTINEVNPLYWGVYYMLYYNFSIPSNPFTDSTQIVFWKNFQNAYLTMIAHVDLYLKNLIDYVISSGLIYNTSIIFTADHGDAVGAFGLIEKGFPVKQTENIPLCIFSPLLDDSLKGTTTDKLCSVIDINPTIMSLANIDNPTITNMDGISIFKKNSNGKLELSDIENKGTFLILDNWQTFTSLFYIYGMDKNSNDVYNSDSYKLWYGFNSILPIQYPYKQICYNTKVDGKKYKLVVWYSWLATIQNTDLTTIITNNEIELVRNYINTKFSEYSSQFNNILDDDIYLIKEYYGDINVNIDDLGYTIEQFIEIYTQIQDSNDKVLNLIRFMISLLITSIRNNQIQDLPSFGHPLSTNTFDDYINIINTKKNVFQQLYNLDDDPNELYNLVDFNRTQSVRDANNNLIKTKIWDDMQNVIIEKDCVTLQTTTKFIEAYYKKIMDLLKENINTFKSLTQEKIQEFIVSPSSNHMIVDIFDNMY